MSSVHNPYAAGAGAPPPMLAGRDALRDRVRIAIARLSAGRSAKSVLMVGGLGVGKTVLLQQMRLDAEREGIYTLHLADPRTLSLPAMLAAQLSLVLEHLSQTDSATITAQRALQALASFAHALKGTFTDLEAYLEFEADGTLASDGDLLEGLSTVLEHAGSTAKAAGTALVIFIDEFHCVEEIQLGALIAAMHRCVQSRLPVMLVGAGLPLLRGRAGNAKSYAERLFDFPEIGPLPEMEATLAIIKPAEKAGIAFEAAAVALIVEKTQGHPLFLQMWCKHAWDMARDSPITVGDVQKAAAQIVTALDEDLFRVWFDRLSPQEKKYLQALADLGPGPHLAGEIADRQGRRVQALTPVRNSLIAKGLICSSSHGGMTLAIPLFGGFLKRAMRSG